MISNIDDRSFNDSYAQVLNGEMRKIDIVISECYYNNERVEILLLSGTTTQQASTAQMYRCLLSCIFRNKTKKLNNNPLQKDPTDHAIIAARKS